MVLNSLLQLILLISLLANSALAAAGRKGNLFDLPDITWPSWLGGKSPAKAANGTAGAPDEAGTSGKVGTPGERDTDDAEFLEAHNEARRWPGHPPLRWDKDLAAFAQRLMRSYQSECRFDHSVGPYGENMFWSSVEYYSPARVVEYWVAEKDHYNAANNSCAAGQMCHHYKQVIWRRTSAVGCSIVKCDNNLGYLAACEYDPPGNYRGQTPFQS